MLTQLLKPNFHAIYFRKVEVGVSLPTRYVS